MAYTHRHISRLVRWPWQRPWRRIGLPLLLACMGLNLVAYNHARAMTRFATSGQRTPSPGDLGLVGKLWVLCTGVTIPRPTCGRPVTIEGMARADVTFSSGDGTKLAGWHYTRTSPRGTVILFHGYSATKSSLVAMAIEFGQLGFNLLLVDFRGSGDSAGNETSIGFLEALDVVGAMQYVTQTNGPEAIVLYGCSMGGAAILRAIATTAIKPRAIIVESVFDRLTTSVANRFDNMGLPAFPAAPLLVFWGGIRFGFNGFGHNPADYAALVDCPTLVLHGKNDHLAKVGEGMAIYAQLAGPKQLKLFSARHTPLLHQALLEWRAATKEFLAPIQSRIDQPNATPRKK